MSDSNFLPGLRRSLLLACMALAATPTWAADLSDSQIIQRRLEIRETAQDTLAALFEIQPSARFAVEHAAGYGVFSTFGIKVLFAGGNTGRGMVHNNRTRRTTFMRMVGAQAGLGFGISKDRVIWIFETESALTSFVNAGWDFSANAQLSAAVQSSGGSFAGAVSVAPGVYVYRLTDTGLSASVTAGGAKFFKDTDLN